MPTIVPPTLMNLAGLAADGSEPHVRPGNHLRVGHHPVFGLPVAPFIVQRAQLRQRPDGFAGRRDVVFRDRLNRVLTLPITVDKGDEIRATIVNGATTNCIWVAMVTRSMPKPEPQPRRGVAQPFIRNRPGLTVTRADARLATRGARAAAAVRPIDPARLETMLTSGVAGTVGDREAGDLLMRAFGVSLGPQPALLGTRRGAPYTIAAPGIAEVVITGRGVIGGMVWLAATDIDRLKWETVDVLNLPHKEGRRYLSLTNPIDRAEQTLRAQAPKRRPLQETTGAPAPAAAPGFSEPEESDRVHALANPLAADLAALIDGVAPPLTAVETIPITDAAGNPLANNGGESAVSVNHLSRVLQATLDPGVAAWLGYKGLDTRADPNLPSFYRVYGFFRHPLALGAKPESLIHLPINAIPVADRQLSHDAVFKTWMTLAGNLMHAEGRTLIGGLEPATDYLAIGAIAVADPRAIPDPPAPPTLLTPAHVAWLPAVPPAAVREVECPLKDVLVGGTLAAAREQPVPGGFSTLNRAVGSTGWHNLLTLGLTTANDGMPLASADGRQGTIADRYAGAAAARYHIAQQDRFGRWSTFAHNDAAAGPRPKPPRPVVQGNYTQPPVANAAFAGGTLRLRVPMPEAASLAPGSFPLASVRLSFRHNDASDAASPFVAMPDITAGVGTAIAVEANPPAGQPPNRAIPVTLAGPVLAATAQRRMVVTAVWIDAGGQLSTVSEPLRLLMTDPRPPAQLSIPDVLLYASRPDATGLAWIERAWSVAAANTPHYAVYYTDEVRLVAWLRAEGRTVAADAIAGTADRAARAGLLRAIQADFPDHLFERLPDAVVAPTATERRFRHAVSGSSRVLNAYKIAVEAPGSGARPSLAGLDTVFYGVPNSDPPPRPTVSVRLVEPAPGEPPVVVEVTVTVEPGVTQGLSARIFRTRGTQADPMHAPVIADVALSAPDAVTGRQTAVFRDRGTALVAPSASLTAFARYLWTAQVQGAPESGSAVPGLWSRAADPVSLATVPLAAPQAPVFDGFGGTAVAGGTQDITIAVSHPLGLRPTPLGPWRFEVLRAAPGDPWTTMASGEIREVPLVVTDPVAGNITPAATSFSLRLYDPIGRSTTALALTS